MLFLDAAPKAETAPFDIINSVIQWCTQNGLSAIQKVIIAVVVLWVGFKLIKFLKKRVRKIFDKNNLDRSSLYTLNIKSFFLKTKTFLNKG